MLSMLIKFEWLFHTKKILFIVGVLSFAFFGFMVTAGGLQIPKVNINSPYMISYALSLASMGAIFVVALFGANSILRDHENKMTEMVFVTPVTKFQFLFSRFLGTLAASLAAFSGMVLGMMLALSTPMVDPMKLGDINLWHYAWSLLLIALPNVLFCSSVIFLIGTLSRHRISIYIGGFAIYVLYMATAVFTGAPWMANVSPASAEAISLAAILDPLGISAFYEQTGNWSNLQRNTEVIRLEGNFLINRILWMAISVLILFMSYKLFSFRTLKKTKKKPATSEEKVDQRTIAYQPATIQLDTFSARWQSFWSLTKIEVSAIVKSLPFLVTIFLWLFIMGMETFSMIQGGSRMQGNYPLTSFMMSNILEVFSSLAIIVIIFYGSEQMFRNRSVKIDELLDTSPVSNLNSYFSKYLALLLLPLTMILSAIVLAVAAQISVGYFHFEPGIYLMLFYYGGVPLLIVISIAFFIQNLVKNKYLGLVLSAILIFLVSSQFGTLVGLEHLLFKIAVPFYGVSNIEYSDFNGFDAYSTVFHWRMIYGLSFAAVLLLITLGIWNRGTVLSLKHRFSQLLHQSSLQWKFSFVTMALLFIASGSYIFYPTNVSNEYTTRQDRIEWRQQYEEKYKQFEELAEPAIIDVNSEVALFPEENRYEVNGKYVLVNDTEEPMLKALLALSKASHFTEVKIAGASITHDEHFGQYWVSFEEPFLPGDTIEMSFQFTSGWSGFTSHTPFNAILENGSFMRISNYFPYFGYDDNREISNPDTRKKLGLPEKTISIKNLEEDDTADYTYNFTQLEMTISTVGDQTVVFPGNLINEWKEDGRNYFQYKSARPGPFRFAIASARYAISTSIHKGVAIEIYHHPAHTYNVENMIESVKQTLDYCTENFGPYQYDTFRYVEVSKFTSGFAATAYPQTIYNIENRGFLSDQRNKEGIDIILQLVAHEFGHQWWAGQVDPETREGGIVMTETLAQYTEIMLYEHLTDKRRVMDALNLELELYLRGRGFEEEVPLYKAKFGQPAIPYSKGVKVMYAIKDLIGEQNLNKALASLIEKYAWPKLPPTSLDLLDEIYAVSPPETHTLINDWVKRIVIYDLKATEASYKRLENAKYEVTLKLDTKRYEEDGNGVATKIPLNEDFIVGIFSGYDVADENNVIYLKKHHFNSDNSELKITVTEKPAYVGVDPFVVMIDRNMRDNVIEVE